MAQHLFESSRAASMKHAGAAPSAGVARTPASENDGASDQAGAVIGGALIGAAVAGLIDSLCSGRGGLGRRLTQNATTMPQWAFGTLIPVMSGDGEPAEGQRSQLRAPVNAGPMTRRTRPLSGQRTDGSHPLNGLIERNSRENGGPSGTSFATGC